MSRYPVIKAHPPWPQGSTPDECGREEAPRQEVTYTCTWDRCGRDNILAFAADVTPPGSRDCRHCGRPAHRDGAPPDTTPDYPGYKSITGGASKWGGGPNPEITPMAQLHKRRSKKDGAAILAARLAEVRASGVAR